jgi:hypothetical protein
MTSSQAALLIWSAVAAVCAVILYRALVRDAGRDPITSCARCRDQRRKGQMILSMPFPMVAAALVVGGALWPVLGPYTLVCRIWKSIRRGYWAHRCDLARQ